MAKKITLKTAKNQSSVADFIEGIADDNLRKDSKNLLKIFKRVTGKKPKMWGTNIIGFGEYTYFRANGDECTFLATGFSPRKSGPAIYIIPGYQNYSDMLEKLGKHKLGKSCLNLKSLADIDTRILEKLITAGLKDLKKMYTTDF